VALRKPSEYFKKETTSSVDKSIQETEKTPELNTFSDAFESFKRNLNNIEIFSEFSEKLDDYLANVEKVNHLSKKIEDVRVEIQSLFKKEDVDKIMMSQFLVVEQSIRDVQSKVRGINEENLIEIRSNISSLSQVVNELVEVEIPKYKKTLLDNEIRIVNRYGQLEENVNKNIESVEELVNEKHFELIKTLEGINEKNLSELIEDFELLKTSVSKLKEEDIPKYKGFIVENERKTELKLNNFDEKFEHKLQDFEENLLDKFEEKYSVLIKEFQELEIEIKGFKQEDIPKYKSFIVENERKTELKLNNFDDKLNQKVNEVVDKINSIENINLDVDKKISEKIEEITNLQNKISSKLKNVEEQKQEITKKVNQFEIEIVRNESHLKKQDTYIENVQEKLNEKISDLRDYIENQTDHIKNVQEEVCEIISKLEVEKLEEKNYELIKKIKYIEEVFEKFNTETLTEGLLNEPPEIKNTDSLTPLNQNFVTLDQLQEHYRLFINRIQQQLSTFGGGGETQLKYLDDIVGIATNAGAYDGKYLKYDDTIKKFQFSDVTSGISGITIQNAGSPLGTATTINFSTNLTATLSSGIAEITASGGGSSFSISTNTTNSNQLIPYAVSYGSTTGLGATNNFVFNPSTGNLSAVQFTSISDRSQKKNIRRIDNAMMIINELEGVRFEWIDNNKSSMGLIAQDTEEVLPEVVETNENGVKSVSYGNIIGVLIEAIKEQQIRIEELERKLNA
jgi:hypothetical protein